MKKIEKLTDAQIAKFPEYVTTWRNIGLNTDKVDFENAKAATIALYEKAGLAAPTRFEIVNSPMEAIDLIRSIDPSRSKMDILNEFSYGAHEAGWLSFYAFFHYETEVELDPAIDHMILLAKSTGWVSFYDEVVVFQHRPEIIKFDDTNRLHCQNGPAIRYRDGYSIYAWHGTRIPAEWIEKPETLTASIAMTWPNIEQRRCAMEILGWNKILKELDAKIIDEDGDPEIGTLLEVNIPEIGVNRFLRVLCGTKREFALPVPPDMKTALESQAWTYGLTLDEFKAPEIRT